MGKTNIAWIAVLCSWVGEAGAECTEPVSNRVFEPDGAFDYCAKHFALRIRSPFGVTGAA